MTVLSQRLTEVRGQLHVLRMHHQNVHLEFACASKLIHQQDEKFQELRESFPAAVSAAALPLPVVPLISPEVSGPFAVPCSVQKKLLSEFVGLAKKHPTQRHPSEEVRFFSVGFQAINPQPYWLAGEVIPMLSVTAIQEWINLHQQAVIDALLGGDVG
jgi:hypothetical protein